MYPIRGLNMLTIKGTFIKPVKVKEADAKEFFRQMQAFTFGLMQDMVGFFAILEKKKIPIEVALGAIKFGQNMKDSQWHDDVENRKKWKTKAKRCPDCGQILALAPVNAPEGPSNLKGYKSIWHCTRGWEHEDPEKWCGYHSYSNLTANKILKKMRIKSRAG